MKKPKIIQDVLSAQQVSRWGVQVGRRVKDEDGRLWIVARIDPHPQADRDAVVLTRVPWTPLMRGLDFAPSSGSIAPFR